MGSISNKVAGILIASDQRSSGSAIFKGRFRVQGILCYHCIQRGYMQIEYLQRQNASLMQDYKDKFVIDVQLSIWRIMQYHQLQTIGGNPWSEFWTLEVLSTLVVKEIGFKQSNLWVCAKWSCSTGNSQRVKIVIINIVRFRLHNGKICMVLNVCMYQSGLVTFLN